MSVQDAIRNAIFDELIEQGYGAYGNDNSPSVHHLAEAVWKVVEADTKIEEVWFARYVGKDQPEHHGRIYGCSEEMARNWSVNRPDVWQAVRKSRRVFTGGWTQEDVKWEEKDVEA